MYFYDGACGKTENTIAIKQQNQSEQGKIPSDNFFAFPGGR